MSTRTRGPAHQNAFAFRHNPKSKKTAKILAAPNEGLCKRCHDKVEWRKKYRKYKPLTAPAVCNHCHQRTVRAAYHSCCQSCSKEKGVCAGCNEKKSIFSTPADSATRIEEERVQLEKQLEGLALRKKRTLLRQFDKSNGLIKPSEAEIAKAAGEGSDDEDGFSDDFDDDDFGYDNEDDDLMLDDDPLEKALSRMQAGAVKGVADGDDDIDGRANAKLAGGGGQQKQHTGPEEEEEEDDDDDEDEDDDDDK